MPVCPECRSETKVGERFCPQCGARLPDTPPPSPGATMILPPTPPATPATARLDQPPAATDATILAQPAEPATGATMLSPAATDATILAQPGIPPTSPLDPKPPAGGFGLPQPPASGFGLPSSQPPSGQTPPPPVGSYTVPQAPQGGFSVPQTPGGAAPAPVNKGKTNWLLIIGIIGGVLVLGCILVVGALAFIGRQVADTVSSITPDASVLETVVSGVSTSVPETDSAFGSEVLTDDFSSEPASQFVEDSDSDGSFAFTNGVYVLTLEKPKFFMWSAANKSYDDFSVDIEATVEGPADGAAAILFRYVDDKNFYILRVYGDGSYGLQRYLDDEPTELVERVESSDLNGLGQTNRVRIEAVGDSIKLYGNGELLSEVTDDSFSSGDLALGISAQDDAGVTVTYDNLSVRRAK